jgi:hypothetical protein
MADLLDRIKQQINTRLEELRPLVDEQHRLEAALQALGNAAPRAPAAKPRAPASARTPKVKPAKTRKRAPRGANREAVLSAVRDRPGATSAELAHVSGVERNTLYALLARLVKEGELEASTLPTGRTGYALKNRPTP